ncbi:MAG: TolC family protein [Gammaproteobacteria bacterium]|nr:MAG: TolC family protein [Gammaproteobacteria bacterium]
MQFTQLDFRTRALYCGVHRRRRVVRCGLALVIVLAATPVAAFAATVGSTPLSLAEAVRLAEAESPAIAARQAAAESAEDAIIPAGALPDPQLVAGIDNLPVTTGDAFSLTDDFMTMRKIGVMQDVPRREKRHLRTERAQGTAARERALLTSERLSVRESVARAWIARASAERRLELLRDLEPRAQAQFAATTAALSAGRGSAADAIAAKAEQAMLADRINQVEREVDETRADFTRWLPEAAERPLGDAPNWAELGVDPDSLIANATHHRELLAYAAAEQVATTEVSLARAEKLPDWSVEFDYAQRGPRYSNMISLEFRMTLPIFPGGRQNPMIASKQAALAQIQAEREDARRMHTAELRKTVAAWRSARDRVERYEHELLPLADDRVDAALAAYRGGRGDLQASLIALGQVIEQRIAYTELQNTLGQAWAALHFAFPQEH